MKLKEGINYTDFLLKVRLCKGEVHFKTMQGDVLNLKSMLSEFVFISATANPELIQGGVLLCHEKEDYTILAEYVEESESWTSR